MSLPGRFTSNVAREACETTNDFFTLAVAGLFGSSWCAVSDETTGWLSPKPSALSPVRSTVEENVTSKLPESDEVACVTLAGSTFAEPRFVSNGTSNLSPWKLHLVLDDGVQALLCRSRRRPLRFLRSPC